MRARRVILLALALLLAAPLAGAQAKTMRFRIGPIVVGGYQTNIKTQWIRTPQMKGSISYMHARLVDAKGTFVPQQEVMLHHVAFSNEGRFPGDKQMEYCGKHTSERVYGTGEEDQSLILPPGYGYHVRKDDRWHVSWMLMNHRFAARKVYVEWTVRITPGWGDIGVTPYWVGLAPCPPDPIFNVAGGGAPGSDSVRTRSWTPPKDGRIVAVGTHLHGGSKSMAITQPSCGNRTLVQSDPEYGMPDDPIYHVIPNLHEPGPRFTSYPLSAEGIPIQGGQRLSVQSVYDGELPHARAMAIMHVYVAPAKAPVPRCAPLPGDVKTIDWDQPFRTDPPKVVLPLTQRDSTGRAQIVDDLPGPFWKAPKGEVTVRVRNTAFSRTKIEIARGQTIRWIFEDKIQHDVTLANGPRAFGSQFLSNGASYRRRFDVPGTYQLFCSLHPVDMHQVVVVK